MRPERVRTTGQAISFILIGPTLICLGPSPSELAHPSLPLVIRMIQEPEDTRGHLKGAQEPPSLHRLVSLILVFSDLRKPEIREDYGAI